MDNEESGPQPQGPGVTAGMGRSASTWDFDLEELPSDGNEELEGNNVRSSEELLSSRLEQLDCFGTEAGNFDIPTEAQPFHEFAFQQAGAGTANVSGVKVLMIVHDNGVHRLPVRWCRC